MRNNVGLFVTKRALMQPDTEALVDLGRNRRFTFTELNDRVNMVADALHSIGVTKGDRVGLLLMNSTEFVESFFALAKLGAVVVPLNWRLVADELEFILKDSGTSVLIFGEEFGSSVAELQSRGDRTDVREWLHVGAEATRAPFARDYAALTADRPPTEPEIVAEGSDLLYIMYTSGTTGLPKGVMHSHDTQIWAVLTIAATADFRHGDRYLNPMPMFHVGALTPALAVTYSGCTHVLMRAFDPNQAWELMDTERIDNSLMVPAMLTFMRQLHDPAKHRHERLRWIMSGASPVPVTLIEEYAAMGVEIHQVYGLTESCGPACLTSPEDALRKAGSTGKAFFHTDVQVVRPDGTECAANEPGEVVVRGPHIMLGYWNRPEATAETLRDGWLHTGDVAVVDDEGFVYIQDRLKDMIISGGENVYPAEIENVILGHPGVADVAVIGLPSQKWGESPLAVVVRKDPALTPADVINHCEGKLARFKMPKSVEFVDVIPRNPSGKALKRELRQQYTTAVD
jgi:O-succinylbenzoate-CoA ligase